MSCESGPANACCFALSLVPECDEVIAHGTTALSPGGSFAVLDLKLPEASPRWLVALPLPIVRLFAVTEEVIARRPWVTIRAAMQEQPLRCSCIELFFGLAFLAIGEHESGKNTKDI